MNNFWIGLNRFPAQHFGKMYGLMMSLSAVVSLLQYPCFALVKAFGGDPFYVSLIGSYYDFTSHQNVINMPELGYRYCHSHDHLLEHSHSVYTLHYTVILTILTLLRYSRWTLFWPFWRYWLSSILWTSSSTVEAWPRREKWHRARCLLILQEQDLHYSAYN